MSQTYYALRVLADLNDGDTGKFAPYEASDNSRHWYRSPTGDDQWTMIPHSNPDSGYKPTLYYLPDIPDKSDLAQFEVYYADLGPSTHIIEVEILASFGSQNKTKTKLASPFRRDGGNIRTALGLDGITRKPNPDHFLIGPFQVSLDRIKEHHVVKDTFEFNLVARFTLLTGEKKQILEFGYDPEMEVEMGSGPVVLPPGDLKA